MTKCVALPSCASACIKDMGSDSPQPIASEDMNHQRNEARKGNGFVIIYTLI
jgi:hypothetical protein